MIKPSETSDILQQQLDNVDLKAEFEEIGTVLEVGDGVANVFGLDNVTSGELIEFENGVRGVAMNLEEDQVGVVLLNLGDRVKENFTAKRTGHIASIHVGEGLLGRVIDTLGEPHRRGRADYRRSVGTAFGKKGSRGNLSAAC